MKTITKIPELQASLARLIEPVGLVPTMGYLHEGHLSLVRTAKAECASVVVSIFVNPTQFGPHEDLDHYPRDLQRDLDLLDKEGVDIVWTPNEQTMYPREFQTWVNVEKISGPLEGSMRPGHFRGVTTVVAKLFNVVRPNKAYFGQKDAQQVAIIRQMVRDLNFDLQVITCPIVRESDGLALSSRNSYLKSDERRAATVLWRALKSAQDSFSTGQREAETLRQQMIKIIKQQPLARLQYISCADPKTLQELEGEIKGQALLSMAVYIGKTRLIDNCLIGD